MTQPRPRDPSRWPHEHDHEVHDESNAPSWLDEDDADHLKALHQRMKKIADQSSAIWRVIGGYSALSNPSNQLIDLTNDVIELHPRIVGALAAQQAMAGVEISGYSIAVGEPSGHVTIERALQRDNSYLWKLKCSSECLSKGDEWEFEPLPTSRDDDFLKRCRFATQKKPSRSPALRSRRRDLAHARVLGITRGLGERDRACQSWRAGSVLAESVLWIAVGVVLVVAAHLLPALCRPHGWRLRALGAALWVGCMVATCYGPCRLLPEGSMLASCAPQRCGWSL